MMAGRKLVSMTTRDGRYLTGAALEQYLADERERKSANRSTVNFPYFHVRTKITPAMTSLDPDRVHSEAENAVDAATWDMRDDLYDD